MLHVSNQFDVSLHVTGYTVGYQLAGLFIGQIWAISVCLLTLTF